MSLLQPLGLLVLAALPAIVLLHLLHERSRRLVIPSLELWRWLERQVRGPRARRLPLTWVLAFQLSAATLLGLGLSRPQPSRPRRPAAPPGVGAGPGCDAAGWTRRRWVGCLDYGRVTGAGRRRLAVVGPDGPGRGPGRPSAGWRRQRVG